MTVRVSVRYFASLRETLGVEGESLVLSPGLASVAGLRAVLMGRGPNWACALGAPTVCTAVNLCQAHGATPLCEGDEVAFFPPVTGG